MNHIEPIEGWDRSAALHVRDVSEFALSSVATLDQVLVRMSAEESAEASADEWAAGEAAETSADTWAVGSNACSRMLAGESAEASADE